ncbi:MAG: hypothetical protein CMJ65_16135 [Planctomycetaceae bacterium]|nr:hypothetical protein [Planctomycetaceae bacterium]
MNHCRIPSHCRLMLAICLLLPLAGCPDDPPAPGPGKGTPGVTVVEPLRLTPKLIAENNRGVGLLEQYRYDQAGKVFAALVKQQPRWLDAKVNLAIAVLNETQKGSVAVPILEEVVIADPEHAAATYCLGISLFHANRIPAAMIQFRKAVKQDPRDSFAAYFMARCLEQEQPAEATTWYQKALGLEPYFQSAHYRCWDLLRQVKKFDEAGRHMEEFSLLREHPLSVSFEYKYTLMGPKALAIRVGLPGVAGSTKRPDGPVFHPPATIAAADSLRLPAAAGLTTCDINADGRQDLFITTPVGSHLLLAGAKGKAVESFVLAPEHPLVKVTGVIAPLWGDFDNDGLVDVYFCRRGTNQLWKQVKPGQWQDVTGASKAGGADLETIDGVCLDLDHDADLDLLLIQRGGPAQLLNNNRDGTFEDISKKVGVDRSGAETAAVTVADFDGDRDLDLLLLDVAGKGPRKNILLWNDRSWRYHADGKLGDLATASLTVALAADTNADAQVELYTAGGSQLARWQRALDGSWSRQGLELEGTRGAIGEGTPRMALADVSGDGRLELLVGTSGWSAWRVPDDLQDTRLVEVADSGEHEPLSAWTPVALDHARGPAIVGMLTDGAPLTWAAGSGRFEFFSVALSGKKKGRYRERSNASGLGNQILTRVGGRTIRASSLPTDSGPGQSLQPVAVGLGGAGKADYVKVVWSEGVTQGRLDLAVGSLYRIEEEDLMPTSCPVLFAWDGTRYRFVSDLLAVGGLGYLIAPGQYAPPDPTENMLLPAGLAQPHNGRYRLKLTEPMPELTYVDRVGLVAWDLPPGWHMTLDERLATALPDPSGEPIFFRDEQPPRRVTNDRNADMTQRVASVDHRAAEVGALDRRFLGRLAGEHSLVLEFDEPLDAGPGQPVLVADGWVEFPYSQTAFSAWQAGASFDSPTLEARDRKGRWVTVAPSFGYPGGMPRQITLPLKNLPRGTRALRLRTNLEIYWDRLTIVRSESCPGAVRRELDLVEADLRESGFMVRQLKDQFRPHFDYDQRAAHPEIVDPEGFYTRLGAVNELVETVDDAVAIFGPGEEIHVEFAAPGKVVPEGWTRRLVLETVGWCKDMDLYTGDGQTVGPLPGTGRPARARDRLHRRFNTRYQRGW